MSQYSYFSRLALSNLFIFFSFTLFSFTYAICYFPDGITVANNDVPCQDTDESVCCGPGYACLSNKICQWTKAVVGDKPPTPYFRGSCTDPTFRSENCPLFCLGSGETPNGGIGMSQCPDSDTLFYCQGDKHVEAARNCSAKNPQTPPLIIFSSAATTVTVIGVKTTTSGSTTITTTGDTSTATGASSTSTTSSSPPSATTSSSSSSASSSSSSESSSSNLPVAVGAGVGVPLGLLVIAIIGWIVFRIRRTKKKDKVAQAAAGGATGGMNPAYHDDSYKQYATPKYQDTSSSYVRNSPYSGPQHPAELSTRDAVELQ